jgi:polyhydroxyalkanoate synthesis regulator phasin
MAEKAQAADSKTTGDTATPPPAPRRPPGHRSTDVRDTVAEMAARAQEISQEAGSKVAQAMRDVINAAAGLAGFAIESARDLVQYMVRRGQMTQEEADRLIREAEEAYLRRKPVAPAARPAPRAEATKPAVTQSAAAKKTTPQKTAKTAKASAKKTAAAPARAKTSRKATAAKKRK